MKNSDIFFDISKDFFDIYVDIMTYSKNSNIFSANVEGFHICMYLHLHCKFQNTVIKICCNHWNVQVQCNKKVTKIAKYIDMLTCVTYVAKVETKHSAWRSGHQHFYQAVNIPSLVHHSRPALDSLPGGGGALQGTSESLWLCAI